MIEFRDTIFQHQSHHQRKFPSINMPGFPSNPSLCPQQLYIQLVYCSLGAMVAVLLALWFRYIYTPHLYTTTEASKVPDP